MGQQCIAVTVLFTSTASGVRKVKYGRFLNNLDKTCYRIFFIDHQLLLPCSLSVD